MKTALCIFIFLTLLVISATDTNAYPSITVQSPGYISYHPSYLSYSYGRSSQNNIPRHSYNAGAGLEAQHRIWVIQQRNRNPTYRMQYTPVMSKPVSYTRNYYTTDYPAHSGIQSPYYYREPRHDLNRFY